MANHFVSARSLLQEWRVWRVECSVENVEDRFDTIVKLLGVCRKSCRGLLIHQLNLAVGFAEACSDSESPDALLTLLGFQMIPDSITRTPLEYAYFLLIGREWKLNAQILSLAVFDSVLFPFIYASCWFVEHPYYNTLMLPTRTCKCCIKMLVR